MPIDLGLARISRLLSSLGNPHLAYNSIHVAGTNGKGSTVAYLSSVLTQAKIRNGRFTSPHMIHYNDCICVNGEVYPMHKFDEISKIVERENRINQLGCTEFELLTATAFKIFEVEKIHLAVIEVGLGGRLDATNVLEPPSLISTAITKIGVDHEAFLGNSLAKIAGEKAGIIKTGVPIVVDKTNTDTVLDVIRAKASETNSELYEMNGSLSHGIISPLKGTFQKQNLSIALKVIELIRNKFPIDESTIREGIQKTKWPGRLESVKFKGINVLLDGAHNESAAIELGNYLNHLRQTDENSQKGFIFIIAMTFGKSADDLLRNIVSSQDKVIVTGFRTPDKMPWIKNMPLQDLQNVARNYTSDVIASHDNINDVIDSVATDGRSIVVCGSLYLCSDLLRCNQN